MVWPLILSPTEKAVLVALADAARDPNSSDRSSQAWPPMKGRDGKLGLVDRTCLTDRAIQKAIKALVAAGHITRTERPGLGCTYTVHPRTTFAPNEVRPEPRSHTPERRSDKPSGTISSSTKTTSSPKKRVRPVSKFELPEWVPVDPWNAWLDMRRTKGGKDTAYALNLAISQLRKLADAGHPPGDVLDQSTLSRWTKLYPIKDNHNGLSQRNDHAARTGTDAVAGPRRGLGADMLTTARARPDDGSEIDPRDDWGIESPLPAYLRR